MWSAGAGSRFESGGRPHALHKGRVASPRRPLRAKSRSRGRAAAWDGHGTRRAVLRAPLQCRSNTLAALLGWRPRRGRPTSRRTGGAGASPAGEHCHSRGRDARAPSGIAPPPPNAIECSRWLSTALDFPNYSLLPTLYSLSSLPIRYSLFSIRYSLFFTLRENTAKMQPQWTWEKQRGASYARRRSPRPRGARGRTRKPD